MLEVQSPNVKKSYPASPMKFNFYIDRTNCLKNCGLVSENFCGFCFFLIRAAVFSICFIVLLFTDKSTFHTQMNQLNLYQFIQKVTENWTFIEMFNYPEYISSFNETKSFRKFRTVFPKKASSTTCVLVSYIHSKNQKINYRTCFVEHVAVYVLHSRWSQAKV